MSLVDEADSEYWDRLEAAIDQTTDARDRTIVALSSAALGASIALVELVFDKATDLWIMELAWALFAASAVSALLSMETAEHSLVAIRRQLGKGEKVDRTRPGGWRANLTWLLNRVAVWTFVLGIGCLMWFAVSNIGKG
jgi:hypothetical protein